MYTLFKLAIWYSFNNQLWYENGFFLAIAVAPYSGWTRMRDILSIIALAGGLSYAAYRFYKVWKLIYFENTLHANIGLWNDITWSLSPETNSKFERRVAPKWKMSWLTPKNSLNLLMCIEDNLLFWLFLAPCFFKAFFGHFTLANTFCNLSRQS